MTSFTPTQIHILINSVTQIILFLVDITHITYFFLMWVKNQNIWKIDQKGDLICQKSYHHVDDIIRTRETYVILIQLFIYITMCVKYFCQVSIRLNKGWKKSHSVEFESSGNIFMSIVSNNQRKQNNIWESEESELISWDTVTRFFCK